MHSFCRTGLVAMATVAFLAAADAPYMGKWKLNLAKSRLTGETLSIEKTPSGSMKYVTAEVSYDFKTDGKEYPTPRGATVTWKDRRSQYLDGHKSQEWTGDSYFPSAGERGHSGGDRGA